MKLFFCVLLAATVIGGFTGAEILDTPFSILGAVIGGVATAAVLLGLGAYFSTQEDKSPELTDEMRGVFDRMITGKENPTQAEIHAAKKKHRRALKTSKRKSQTRL